MRQKGKKIYLLIAMALAIIFSQFILNPTIANANAASMKQAVTAYTASGKTSDLLTYKTGGVEPNRYQTEADVKKILAELKLDFGIASQKAKAKEIVNASIEANKNQLKNVTNGSDLYKAIEKEVNAKRDYRDKTIVPAAGSKVEDAKDEIQKDVAKQEEKEKAENEKTSSKVGGREVNSVQSAYVGPGLLTTSLLSDKKTQACNSDEASSEIYKKSAEESVLGKGNTVEKPGLFAENSSGADGNKMQEILTETFANISDKMSEFMVEDCTQGLGMMDALLNLTKPVILTNIAGLMSLVKYVQGFAYALVTLLIIRYGYSLIFDRDDADDVFKFGFKTSGIVLGIAFAPYIFQDLLNICNIMLHYISQVQVYIGKADTTMGDVAAATAPLAAVGGSAFLSTLGVFAALGGTLASAGLFVVLFLLIITIMILIPVVKMMLWWYARLFALMIMFIFFPIFILLMGLGKGKRKESRSEAFFKMMIAEIFSQVFFVICFLLAVTILTNLGAIGSALGFGFLGKVLLIYVVFSGLATVPETAKGWIGGKDAVGYGAMSKALAGAMGVGAMAGALKAGQSIRSNTDNTQSKNKLNEELKGDNTNFGGSDSSKVDDQERNFEALKQKAMEDQNTGTDSGSGENETPLQKLEKENGGGAETAEEGVVRGTDSANENDGAVTENQAIDTATSTAGAETNAEAGDEGVSLSKTDSGSEVSDSQGSDSQGSNSQGSNTTESETVATNGGTEGTQASDSQESQGGAVGAVPLVGGAMNPAKENATESANPNQGGANADGAKLNKGERARANAVSQKEAMSGAKGRTAAAKAFAGSVAKTQRAKNGAGSMSAKAMEGLYKNMMGVGGTGRVSKGDVQKAAEKDYTNQVSQARANANSSNASVAAAGKEELAALQATSPEKMANQFMNDARGMGMKFSGDSDRSMLSRSSEKELGKGLTSGKMSRDEALEVMAGDIMGQNPGMTTSQASEKANKMMENYEENSFGGLSWEGQRQIHAANNNGRLSQETMTGIVQKDLMRGGAEKDVAREQANNLVRESNLQYGGRTRSSSSYEKKAAQNYDLGSSKSSPRVVGGSTSEPQVRKEGGNSGASQDFMNTNQGVGSYEKPKEKEEYYPYEPENHDDGYLEYEQKKTTDERYYKNKPKNDPDLNGRNYESKYARYDNKTEGTRDTENTIDYGQKRDEENTIDYNQEMPEPIERYDGGIDFDR